METCRDNRKSKIDFKDNAMQCGALHNMYWKENKHDTTGEQTESR